MKYNYYFREHDKMIQTIEIIKMKEQQGKL